MIVSKHLMKPGDIQVNHLSVILLRDVWNTMHQIMRCV